MPTEPDLSARADLVASIHAPWQATVGECLDRWEMLGPADQSQSYIVLRGDAGVRRTLNAVAIAKLAELSGGERKHASQATNWATAFE